MVDTMGNPAAIPEALWGERFRPLRAEDYYRLLALGSFERDDRVELLDGLLVPAMSDGEVHFWVTQRLLERLMGPTLQRGLPLAVACQSSVLMGEYQVPMPDIIVVEKRKDFARPFGGLLVAEIADTSLRRDRTLKARIYAAAGVPEYWVIDTNGEQAFVHTAPMGDTYGNVEVIPRAGTLRPRALPGVEISVDELFRRE
jgi:Uma2 family endonuclease